jgi:uncharacterized protein YndB with AHSA1/START domain
VTQGTPRQLRKQIRIKSSLSTVWTALTTADDISRWYPLDARVEPGEGGQIWLGWPGHYEQQVIEIWHEARQLQTRDETRAVTLNWTLEGVGTETLVGFELTSSRNAALTVACGACGEVHPDEFDGLARGWTIRLLGLKYMLEQHPYGLSRQLVMPLTLSGGTPDELWALLVGDAGLALERPGTGRYRALACTCEWLEGEVDVWAPPRALALTVRSMNNARLTIDIRGCAVEWTAWFCLFTYGLDRAALRAIEARWKPALQALVQRLRPTPGRRERVARSGSIEAP